MPKKIEIGKRYNMSERKPKTTQKVTEPVQEQKQPLEETVVKKTAPKKTEADVIWDEIKELPIAMYALPKQTVQDHVIRRVLPGKAVYLRPKSPAVVASLGEALGEDFTVDVVDGGFIVVARREKLPGEEEEEFIYFPRPNGKVDKIPKKM